MNCPNCESPMQQAASLKGRFSDGMEIASADFGGWECLNCGNHYGPRKMKELESDG